MNCTYSPFERKFLHLFKRKYGVGKVAGNQLLNALEDKIPDFYGGSSTGFSEDEVTKVTQKIFYELFHNKTIEQARVVLQEYSTQRII